MSLIRVSDLTFAYDGSYDNVFEKASFQLDTSWRTGLVGRNGRGKTTFLRLLQGKYAYSGAISANVDFEYFPYEVPDENAFGIDAVREIAPQAEDWEINRELSLLDVSEDALWQSFCLLSGGEKTKLLLAALFLRSNSFLLLDEPTNHLDAEARRKIGDYLCKKSGFILVSHDRELLDKCTDYTISLNKTSIDVEKGSFSVWYENKCNRDEYEIRENKRLKKEIKSLEAAARRASDWSYKAEKGKFNTTNSGVSVDRGYVGHKAAKMMKKAKVIENRSLAAAEEKEELLKDVEISDSLKITPLTYFSEQIAALDKVSVSYGDKTVCENISFSIHRGDRIALQGRNGCGKSSILKLIAGENITYGGNLVRSERLIVSYVKQDSSGISGSLSDYAKKYSVDENLLRAILSKMDVPYTQFFKDIACYSEGQKKKLMLARSLCQQAHLYIWDEPLNYIDIFSRIQLEELILKYCPTIIFVEHDSVFTEKIATDIVVL